MIEALEQEITDMFNFSNGNFSKSTELLLITPNTKSITDILETAHSLKRFHLDTKQYGVNSPSS